MAQGSGYFDAKPDYATSVPGNKSITLAEGQDSSRPTVADESISALKGLGGEQEEGVGLPRSA